MRGAAGRWLVSMFFAAIIGLMSAAPHWPTNGLVCAREWGNDDLGGARMAVAGRVGGGSFDGFLIGVVESVEGHRHLSGEFVTFQTAVAIRASPSKSLRVGVSANGPNLQLTPGKAYFVTLEDAREAGVEELYLHPCGPAFEVGGPDIASVLAIAPDFEVVDQRLLTQLEGSQSTASFSYAFVLAVLVGTLVIVSIASFVGSFARTKR